MLFFHNLSPILALLHNCNVISFQFFSESILLTCELAILVIDSWEVPILEERHKAGHNNCDWGCKKSFLFNILRQLPTPLLLTNLHLLISRSSTVLDLHLSRLVSTWYRLHCPLFFSLVSHSWLIMPLSAISMSICQVTSLSHIESKKRFEFLEAVSATMDSHLRYFKQVAPCIFYLMV